MGASVSMGSVALVGSRLLGQALSRIMREAELIGADFLGIITLRYVPMNIP